MMKTSGNYKIRVMTLEDIEEILLIENELFTSPWSMAMFVHEILNHKAFVLTETSENLIVGYTCGWKVLDEYQITNVGIAKAYQRRGLAEYLLIKVIKLMLEEFCFNYFLEVRESNISAIQLYRKLGFIEIGRRKNYYNNPIENALIMHLNLGSGKELK